jgi:hypothetical protein
MTPHDHLAILSVACAALVACQSGSDNRCTAASDCSPGFTCVGGTCEGLLGGAGTTTGGVRSVEGSSSSTGGSESSGLGSSSGSSETTASSSSSARASSGSSSGGGTSSGASSSVTGWSGGGTSSGSSSTGSSSSGGSSSAACTNETWSNFAEGFFSSYCSECHSQFTTYSNVVNDASSITSKISSGEMPLNTTLSSSEQSDILTWLGCGEPQ